MICNNYRNLNNCLNGICHLPNDFIIINSSYKIKLKTVD